MSDGGGGQVEVQVLPGSAADQRYDGLGDAQVDLLPRGAAIGAVKRELAYGGKWLS